MKKIFAILLLLATFTVANSTATTDVKLPLKASQVYLPVGNTDKTISVMELSTISMKELQKLTGRKMNLLERGSFKAGQKKLRNSINSDGTFNKKTEKLFNKTMAGGGGFHAGGFFLGFLIGAIGVVIAYVINDDKKKARVKWAWIGFGVSVVLSIIIIIAATAASI